MYLEPRLIHEAEHISGNVICHWSDLLVTPGHGLYVRAIDHGRI